MGLKMLEALSALVFWKRKDERRKEVMPVLTDRRRISPRKAQQQLIQSVDRLSEAVSKRCGHTK